MMTLASFIVISCLGTNYIELAPVNALDRTQGWKRRNDRLLKNCRAIEELPVAFFRAGVGRPSFAEAVAGGDRVTRFR